MKFFLTARSVRRPYSRVTVERWKARDMRTSPTTDKYQPHYGYSVSDLHMQFVDISGRPVANGGGYPHGLAKYDNIYALRKPGRLMTRPLSMHLYRELFE